MRDFARASHNSPEKNTATQWLGQTGIVRPNGFLLWMHANDAADTGAVVALCQELARLRGQTVSALVTSTENATATASLAVHQIVPGETSGSVSQFLNHWTPDLAIFVGPPDRPTLITEAASRKIPMFLAASRRGQITPGGRLSMLASSLLEHFDRFLASSAAEAQALYGAKIEKDRVLVTGPLSDTALALPCNQAELTDIGNLLAGRPVWLAAHVTSNEVAAVEAALRRTIRAAHRLLLIVVPRLPSDGRAVSSAFEVQGWRTALRSEGEEPDETIQVYVADTEDEMGLWYRLAPITFLGGTFDKDAVASDPFEPASLGSVVVHGPDVGNSPIRFDRLRAANASAELASQGDLGDMIFNLLAPDKAATLAHAGWSVTSESAHVVVKLAELIDAELGIGEAS
ncbi:MAG: 3-deoxy-D-manno-octulosonic acid transferase [Boseongicola sp.]